MIGPVAGAAGARRAAGWLWWQFARREVANRFAGSLLGGLWAFVHPLALLLIYSFVFTSVMRVRALADSPVPYFVFLAVVLWPWMAFQEAVMRGSGAMVANGALVKKVPFAHELVVYAAVAGSFAVQMFGYVLALAFIVVAGHPLHLAGLPLVMLAVLTLALLATGLALLLSAVHVFVRDLEQGLSHVLALLFYLSPILYSASMVPEWVRELMLLNPIAVLIEAVRGALLDGRVLPGTPVLLAVLFSAAIFLLGRAVFLRLSPHFEEAL